MGRGIKYYNLEHIESPRKLALQQFVKNHKDWISNPNFANPELHIIICDKCMEIALGRKLLQSDLANVPANKKLES